MRAARLRPFIPDRDGYTTMLSALDLARTWCEAFGRHAPLTPPDPLQRPDPVYLPGLTAKPWWDRADLPWISALEGEHAVIKREVQSLLARGYLQPPQIHTIDPSLRVGDQLLIEGERGGWELFRLYYNGLEIEEN